ncbi:hypothetical protein MYSTI_03617 [Myxococcus stipitatus DSM 14675]|uniref:Uncharacterized protein n=1 Tax=Myxococcus stipitatus (strain DSM 14675 / JCM 12634 / Mx s8) TaxID=1278073 RepID=L7UA71_MYXSD|nr:hypothetical protein [Myxococcus stipitatus]AGC44923.1 hypothetical protein MYSTI_03617 [Myxococcus stipitatus DSM 14675]
MTFFLYLRLIFFGAFGALASLRALEQIIFGGRGGFGPILVQAALGAGALMVAKRALDKLRAQRRPAPSEDSNPS